MNKNSILSIVFVIFLGLGAYFVFQSKEVCEAGGNDKCEDEQVAFYEIHPGDLVEKLQNGEEVVLLDVRTEEEYAENRLAGAILVPLQKLSVETLNDAGISKDKEVYIYCRSGSRSKQAYDLMTALGYTDIKSVAGGIVHWQEDNYPFTEVGEHNGQKIETKITNKIIGPKILFNKTTHNFGVIPQFGGKVETKFIVKNIGVKILEIGEITTSCNCTTASISSASIQIGDEAEITVVFDPNFHDEPTGVFRRTVFIPTNDSDKPEAEITIEVDIDEDR